MARFDNQSKAASLSLAVPRLNFERIADFEDNKHDYVQNWLPSSNFGRTESINSKVDYDLSIRTVAIGDMSFNVVSFHLCYFDHYSNFERRNVNLKDFSNQMLNYVRNYSL